ncbi:MAG: NAD-dependent epimerase/dehydratase family protein [bacterium]|nr:NAD-dependent epimerase/dehydratase family protein [bacterium]MDE0667463.1 NAD-dependent epimerase/dehydratase family protein [bacterium]
MTDRAGATAVSAGGGERAGAPSRPLVVAITGVAGSIGSRLAARLAARTGEVRVVGVDPQPLQSQLDAELRQGDLRTDDVAAMLRGVDVVAHLGSAFDPRRDGLDSANLDIEMVRRLLAAASAANVSGVVLMSSAMVYGAWPTNPVPLGEDALLRPNPGFSFAAHKAELERLAARWHGENPRVRLVVLRPVTAVAAGESSWAARILRAAVSVAAGDDNPPVQFLHLDDLAAAVESAVLGDLTGAYNVAPDGYVAAARMRRLSGTVPWLRVPPQVASWLARFRWRWRLAPTPPGVVPYTRFPWVVSNERLRAVGWAPRHSNEECYVDSHPAKPWAIRTSAVLQRRSLAVLVAVLAVGVGIAIGAMARARRGARSPAP